MDSIQLRCYQRNLAVALAAQGCTTREIQTFFRDECNETIRYNILKLCSKQRAVHSRNRSIRHIQRILKERGVGGRQDEEDNLEFIGETIQVEISTACTRCVHDII